MYISGTYLVVVVVFQALSPGMWTVLEWTSTRSWQPLPAQPHQGRKDQTVRQANDTSLTQKYSHQVD